MAYKKGFKKVDVQLSASINTIGLGILYTNHVTAEYKGSLIVYLLVFQLEIDFKAIPEA